MKITDSVLCVLSDMHTGSSTALFPRKGFVNFDNNLILPNATQRAIHAVFVRLAGEIKVARKKKRLILVVLGDAIDGFHHGSMQESLFREQDQAAAHIELIQEFQKCTGWKPDDELYYVRGTFTHVKDIENEIAKELKAKPDRAAKKYVHEILELNINGCLNLFYHHGKARGNGENEGNALRNYLRDIRVNRQRDGLPRADVSWSGHTHGHIYDSHNRRTGAGTHTFHGIICPSFQAKTQYALEKVPMQVNSIGGVSTTISAAGEFTAPPRFVVQTTRD